MKEIVKLLELPEEEVEVKVPCTCPTSWLQMDAFDPEYEDFRIRLVNSSNRQKLYERFLAKHLREYG